MIYLDNAATTAPSKGVVDAMYDVLSHHYGNPSSGHQLGKEAKNKIEPVRELFSKLMGTKSENIIFTSGATESNNTILKCQRNQAKTRNQIIYFTGEHPSLTEAVEVSRRSPLSFQKGQHEQNQGFKIAYDKIFPLINSHTKMVSISHVNNESGVINDIESIGVGLKKEFPEIHFHIDAVQALFKVTDNYKNIPYDSLSLSAHKFHGPKGVGILAIKNHKYLDPLLMGGGQEFKLRGGTENVAGIVGMGVAAVEASTSFCSNYEKIIRLKEVLLQELDKRKIQYLLFSEQKELSPYIVNLSILGTQSEIVKRVLSDKNICVTNSSACTSNKGDVGRVLRAYHKPSKYIEGALRISFSPLNTEDEIVNFVNELSNTLKYFTHF